MALNQQDIENLVAAMKQSGLARTRRLLTLWGAVALCSIGWVTWCTTGLDRVERKPDAGVTILDSHLDAHLENIDQMLERQGQILARLDEESRWKAVDSRRLADPWMKIDDFSSTPHPSSTVASAHQSMGHDRD